ncbi:MAG: DUF2207 domain-containing protein [Lachnospiraceae bacterium]|nr:DUF2207 domain-containing protein [Lachnospiraceae bacterium]
MNKLIFAIGCLLSIVIFYCSFIYAKNHVDNIDIDVAIHDNGSATITQRWTGTFDEGTEIYIPIEDKSLIIKNFKVWKSNREYLSADGWDVDWSFDGKKWRSGINYTDKGVELCFGISEYGNNIYTFTYDVDPLVKSYRDADGFNFQFVNSNMSIFPSDVNLRIKLDDDKKLTTDNARIWGFGYEGMTAFSEDGYAVAFSTNPLFNRDYMNVTLEIFKGMLNPNVSVSENFEDTVLKRALEGSSYKEVIEAEDSEATKEVIEAEDSEATAFAKVILGIFGLVFLSGIAKIVSKIKRRMSLKRFYKETNYFRDTPNGGSILMTNSLYKDFDIWKNKETNVIGAIIMKMINDGNLKPLKEKSYGFLGREKESTSLKVGKVPKDPLLRELYDIIIQAAGPDNILQENELKKYAKLNYDELVNYLDSLDTKGHNELHREDCYNKIFGTKLKDLTDKGKSELSEVYGLRKFLDEFTLINERSITEGVIWEDLMVYATLFGIAKKVLSELKKIYPDRLLEIEKMSNTYYVSDIYFRSLYYYTLSARRAANVARAASMAAQGLGGASSIGGGGGFSGGGSGGGTR